MSTPISPRLAEIIEALPIRPDSRVLEIGCGPGVAARAVATRLSTGHVLAIDRSATAIRQVNANSSSEIGSGLMSARHVAIEDFTLEVGDDPFDLVFAIRVGSLDGRHPKTGEVAMARIAAATTATARLFIDGGHPVRELEIPRVTD